MNLSHGFSGYFLDVSSPGIGANSTCECISHGCVVFEQYLQLGHVAAAFGDSRSVSYESLIINNLGLRRSVEVTTTNFNNLPQLVIGTTRVATVHTRLARLYARYLPLRLLPLPIELPPLVEVMQWHAINNNDPAHAWMRQVLKEQAAALGLADALGPASSAFR